MRAKLWLCATAAAVVLSSCAIGSSHDKAEQKFKATFKNMPVDAVKDSEIPGIYEVWSQGKIFYYAPKQDLMLFGEFWTVGGKSITQQKIAQYQADRVLTVPSSAGVTVGSGDTDMTAFLDPDCGHCQAAFKWLDSRNFAGVKLHVIFLGMDKRNPAYARAMQFVCAPADLRTEALREIYDRTNPPPGQHLLSCDDGAAKLAEQAEVASSLGISGTPTFIVKGQTVLGFDQARLESLLSGS